jgi:hypothetical protein
MTIDMERPVLSAEDIPEAVQAMGALAEQEGPPATSENPVAPTLEQAQQGLGMAQAVQQASSQFNVPNDPSGVRDISRLSGRPIGITAWRNLTGEQVVLPLAWDNLGRTHDYAMRYFRKIVSPVTPLPVEAQHMVGKPIFVPRPPANPPMRPVIEMDEDGTAKWNCLWCKKTLATETDRESHMRGYHKDRYARYREAVTREEDREQANSTLELNRRMGDLMEQLIDARGQSAGDVVNMLKSALDSNTDAMRSAATVATGQWLTIKAAARALGVSAATIRSRIKAGTIEGRRPNNGRWQVFCSNEQLENVDVQELEAETRFKQEQRVSPPTMTEHETTEGDTAAE